MYAFVLQCRDMSWQSKAAAEAALLLKEQVKLERETGQALFVGLSLADTLTTCFRLGHARAAAALRKTFSVPEARWYWLKLTALAAAHDWDGEHTTHSAGMKQVLPVDATLVPDFLYAIVQWSIPVCTSASTTCTSYNWPAPALWLLRLSTADDLLYVQ